MTEETKVVEVKGHCCVCEISRQRNSRVLAVMSAVFSIIVGVTALAAYDHNWLATAGWGAWSVLGTATLAFSDAWKISCSVHGVPTPLPPKKES